MNARRSLATVVSVWVACGASLLASAPAMAAGAPCANAAIREAQFSSELPDCRAYEMVSPVEKGGGDVAADPTNTQSATDGNAIKFTSVTAFGDATGIEARGAEYLSARGVDGWATHAINPPQRSIAYSVESSAQYLFFSDDLSHGIYFALSPVTPGHPNVERNANLYLRDDVLSAGAGTYELLSDAVSQLPARPPVSRLQEIAVAGASADFSHIIFEASANLTASVSALSPEAPKLYEWDEGVLRLAGILPDGEPAAASVAGQDVGDVVAGTGSAWTQRTISTDGSRVIFEGPPLSDEGSGCSSDHCSLESGMLYMRTNGMTTVQLNASERSAPDPNGPGPARFWTATADDSKIFFTAKEALTDDASGIGTGSSAENLYEYDVDAPAGHHLTLISVDTNPELQGNGPCACGGARGFAVVGISADGSYVYFISQEALLPGEPPTGLSAGLGEDNYLYVWHDGTLRFITGRSSRLAYGQREFWGVQGRTRGNSFRVSADGKTAVFGAADDTIAKSVGYEDPNLSTPTDPFARSEIYTYSYDDDRLACASCNPTGALPVSNASMGDRNDAADFYPATGNFPNLYLNHPLSRDGRKVFFDTEDALVPQDTNGLRDVYEYDIPTGQLHLVSSGSCNCGSQFVDASEDGSDVFFTTHQALVGIDIDNNGDLYDARVDGGIASQNQAPGESCEGDDCQGPVGAAPVFPVPASATFVGLANPSPTQPKAAVRPKARGLTRAQRLARALRTCERKPKRTRVRCRAHARAKFRVKGAKKATKHASRPVGR